MCITELLEGADAYTSLAEVAATGVSVDAPESVTTATVPLGVIGTILASSAVVGVSIFLYTVYG